MTWNRLDRLGTDYPCVPDDLVFVEGHAFNRDDLCHAWDNRQADPATAIGGNKFLYIVGLSPIEGTLSFSRIQLTNPLVAPWESTLVPLGIVQSGTTVDKPFVSVDPLAETVYVHWSTKEDLPASRKSNVYLSVSQGPDCDFFDPPSNCPPEITDIEGIRLSWRLSAEEAQNNLNACGAPCTWGTASAVGPDGEVHFIWNQASGVDPTAPFNDQVDQIRYRRGDWFNGPFEIDPPLPVGASVCTDEMNCERGIVFGHQGFPEGFRRTHFHLVERSVNFTMHGHPSVAVDPNPSTDRCKRGGTVYVAYQAEEYPNGSTNSGVCDTGRTVDSNIYVVRSRDGGETWSPPVMVPGNNGDPTPEPCDPSSLDFAVVCGLHSPFQFFPWIAVDDEGRVGVMFFDTTIDNPTDLPGIGNRCDDNVIYQIKFAYSLDGGNTWEDPVTVSRDALGEVFSETKSDLSNIFIGDYAGMTASSDALGNGVFHPIWTDLREWDQEARASDFATLTPGDVFTATVTISDPVISMGDQDGDGDVDSDDYGRLLACIAGTETDCEDFDFNRDGQVTEADKEFFCECPASVSLVFCATCQETETCADSDSNGVRDDACFWWECAEGRCLGTSTVFPSDMGGAFGACPTDGFCNLADALHALECFSGQNPCDSINIDAGGAFGSCKLDGFCNLADALHAMTCSAGTNACTCGESAMGSPAPEVVGATSLRVIRAPLVAESDTITVRVFAETALDDLQSYQLELRVSGGTSGQFELLDIFIEPRSDYVFDALEENFTAFNIVTGQMLSGGVDIGGGVRTRPDAYLATYTYRATAEAMGDFVVDIPHDDSSGDQTFLVASFNKKIEVTNSTPAVISATPQSDP